MFRQRHINGDPRGRARRAAATAADIARWPFERLAWSLERVLVWPLQRWLAGRGRPGHGAGAVALGAIGVAAILVAVLVLPGSGGSVEKRAAGSAPVAAVTPPPTPSDTSSSAPSLHGIPPRFGVGKGVGVANAGGGEGGAEGADRGQATGAGGSAGGEEVAATASSAGEPVPAGPAAMKVARRFSEAFVYYEVGQRPARTKAVFGETATEQLAGALDERPPRLPAEGRVPKAKVLNLVPGPRLGGQYTVSASLLRVGATSELRLTLKKEKDGAWRVAQVLG